jgi:hypothetical protein
MSNSTTRDKPEVEGTEAMLRRIVREMVRSEKLDGKADVPIGVPAQRVLNALRWLEGASERKAFPVSVVSFFARCTAPETFTSARQMLRVSKLAEHTYGGFMKLTDEGRERSVNELPRTNEPTAHAPAHHADRVGPAGQRAAIAVLDSALYGT